MKKILACLLLMICCMVNAEEVSIKNIEPDVKYSISRQEVYWMYSMRTRFWGNGQKIIVYYQDFNSAAHKEFVAKVLHSTPTRFSESVEIYVNNGNAAYFRRTDNELTLKSAIEKTPGAIGYIDSKYLLINKEGNVQKVLISN